MNLLTISTNGAPVESKHSNMSHYKNKELAVLEITIGEIDISIHFKTHDEMIMFCTVHNFDYDDNR